MTYNNLLLEIQDQVLFLTINRESKLNALNKETLRELHFAITDANQNDEIRGIIITGTGQKAFIAGADISELKDLNVNQAHDLSREGQIKVFDVIEKSTKPIIAAINGFALGGGLELALACHIRIASDHARLGLPEVSLGLIPGYGGTQRLTQLIGKGKAFELILTGEAIPATEACDLGLVNYVVPQDQLIIKCRDIMQKIMARSPIAISSAIRAINAAFSSKINGFDVEILEFANCFETLDFKEGIAAFLEKRKASFAKY